MSLPSSGEWPFDISCADRLRKCAEPGGLKCKRRLVLIVRGVTQLVSRMLDMDNSDLAWILRDL